jgi:DNA-binding transcriptional MerR regulator
VEKKYFTIQEVAQRFAVAPSLIRFWEKEFSSVLQPSKNSKGARRYREKDITQLSYIYSLVKEKGYSLEGARKVIEKRSAGLSITPAEVMQRLHTLRSFLVELKEQIR